MERHIWANAKQAKWIIGGMLGGSLFLQQGIWRSHLINNDVFGVDGNGGHMIKILTNLTDEEMASLRDELDAGLTVRADLMSERLELEQQPSILTLRSWIWDILET